MNDREKMFRPMITVGIVLTALNVYWFCSGFFAKFGLTPDFMFEVMMDLSKTGMFDNQFILKAFAILSLFLGNIARRGRYKFCSWKEIIIYLVVALAVFFLPRFNDVIYIITSVTGLILCSIAFGKLGNKFGGMKDPNASVYETFDQGLKYPIETDYSVNFRIKYMFGGKWRAAFLSVPNVFRGNAIFGGPGSGKSFTLVNEFIWQLIHKGFTSFVYDFKKFELSTFTYNCYLRSQDVFRQKYGVDPYFCFVYMVDPRYSMRCNPLSRKYIPDMSAAIQKAKIIRKNRMDPNKDVGFFADNAETMWVTGIWALCEYEEGRYCTLPHFIELMLSPQDKLMALFQKIPACHTLVRDIIKAGAEGANEQAQGIYASATTPLKELRTERIYWLFSADQVDLRINRKDKPTILVVGTDPENKDAFMTGISLITSELYLKVNVEDRAPCLICQDEFPTMKPEGFDNIVATGRSNLLASVVCAQDPDQMIRDMKKENASALLSIVGNQFYGRMTGTHKREVSEMFGQHKVRQESETTGTNTDSMSTSYHLEKRLPEDKLATLPVGTFAAVIADGRGEEKMDNRLYCADIDVSDSDRPNKKDGKWQEIPMFAAKVFEQEEQQKKVEKDPEGFSIKYIFDELKEIEHEKLSNDSHATIRSEYVLKELAKKKFESLDDDEKKALLKLTIEKEKKNRAKEIMKDKMTEIENDILVMFDYYGIIDPMKAAGAKPEVGTPLNGGEKPETVDPSKMEDGGADAGMEFGSR